MHNSHKKGAKTEKKRWKKKKKKKMEKEKEKKRKVFVSDQKQEGKPSERGESRKRCSQRTTAGK